MTLYRALTWDHPRGFNALAAAAARLSEERDGISIEWHKQPLEGFEAHPIADLCANYDLVVLDHPHIGEAVRAECLQSLDTIFDAAALNDMASRTIGPCFTSYRYAGRQWALPLDAATQVMAVRSDLLGGPPPATWNDVLTVAKSAPVTLSIAGPHAVLSFMSIAVSHGVTPATGGRFVPGDVGEACLDIMARLFEKMPERAKALNPIGILELMSTSDAVAVCPLVYGYVNYASPGGSGRHPVTFADAPCTDARSGRGSVLGGTGIGISRRCKVTPGLIRHLEWLMSEEAQMGFIPAHDGQPSARAAWRDEEVNRRWNGFYAGTANTIETAHVRPRFDGYIAFQTRASALIREGLASRRPHGQILADLEQNYQNHPSSNEER
jgi:multiple sugar transport system substrate-binding protein